MNEFKEMLGSVKKYSEKGNIKLLETTNGKYVIKKKKNDTKKIFDYLKEKKFLYYLEPMQSTREIDIYPYIEDKMTIKEDKAQEIIYLISLLHNKTTFYKKINQDEIKKIFEEKSKNIRYLIQHFDDLRKIIEEEPLFSPSQYLFLRNVSLIYQALDYSNFFLERWYEKIQSKSSLRMAMTHNNLDVTHLLCENTNYLINWEKAKVDLPLYDFFSFYRFNYTLVDCEKLFDLYQSKYGLFEEERYFLYVLLLMPEKKEWTDDERENTRLVYDFYQYLQNVLEFVLKDNSKYTNS